MTLNDFKSKLTECTDHTSKLIFEFPWQDNLAYAEWLAQTYFMVSYSTRLVALAGAEVSLDKENLHRRFVEHSSEEQGHPLLCIKDLKSLGYSIDDFEESTPAACMYQTQYFWIRQVNPAAFFGYALALEDLGARVGPKLYDLVCQHHPKSAASFIKVHSHADEGHVEHGLEEMKSLDRAELEAATTNMLRTAQLYQNIITDIEFRIGTSGVSQAA